MREDEATEGASQGSEFGRSGDREVGLRPVVRLAGEIVGGWGRHSALPRMWVCLRRLVTKTALAAAGIGDSPWQSGGHLERRLATLVPGHIPVPT